jgi:hypothetical protein
LLSRRGGEGGEEEEKKEVEKEEEEEEERVGTCRGGRGGRSASKLGGAGREGGGRGRVCVRARVCELPPTTNPTNTHTHTYTHSHGECASRLPRSRQRVLEKGRMSPGTKWPLCKINQLSSPESGPYHEAYWLNLVNAPI